jgi:hypothetical protein
MKKSIVSCCVALGLMSSFDIKAEVEIHEGYPVTINNPELT